MELLNLKFEDYFNATEITDGGIIFSNGIELSYIHDQDCCESVYADWTAIKESPLADNYYDKLKIESVEGVGIRINEYLVPCYDIQNGYYSSDLELIVRFPDKTIKTYDITNLTHYIEE